MPPASFYSVCQTWLDMDVKKETGKCHSCPWTPSHFVLHTPYRMPAAHKSPPSSSSSSTYRMILFKVGAIPCSTQTCQAAELPSAYTWSLGMSSKADVGVLCMHLWLSCCQSHEDKVGSCPGNQNGEDKPGVVGKETLLLSKHNVA